MKQKLTKSESFVAGCLFIGFIGICAGIVLNSISISKCKAGLEGGAMSKRDFWKMSWNPVWGCLNTCPYCYARRIAARYAGQITKKEFLHHAEKNPGYAWTGDHLSGLKNFRPTWLESNYIRKFPRKPCIIFVNSMSDPAYWKPEWYEKIVSRITENMQHTFVMLTKKPCIYRKYNFPHNTILGITATDEVSISIMMYYFIEFEKNYNNPLLLSVEPIQEKIRFHNIKNIECIDWIHVGEESGNRQGRIRATREMIEPFLNFDIPVFMKDNLDPLFPGKLRKDFPVLRVNHE